MLIYTCRKKGSRVVKESQAAKRTPDASTMMTIFTAGHAPLTPHMNIEKAITVVTPATISTIYHRVLIGRHSRDARDASMQAGYATGQA